MSCTKHGEKYSEWIDLDWYDGPLSRIATVEFDDGVKYVELDTIGYWVETPDGEHVDLPRWSNAHVRLGREDLQKMLDLFDGKPVKSFHDEE